MEVGVKSCTKIGSLNPAGEIERKTETLSTMRKLSQCLGEKRKVKTPRGSEDRNACQKISLKRSTKGGIGRRGRGDSLT